MNKELEIWQFAAERLKQNEFAMLLTVAESSGSSPGRQGFKMIVAQDEMRGSIGGGVMEIALVEQAKLKIQAVKLNKCSEIVEQIHRKNFADASGMICSGRQTVILSKLDSSHLSIINTIIKTLESHQTKTLQITNAEFEISESNTDNFNFQIIQPDKSEFVYREKLGYKNKLYIIGGGHCALALSELMAKMNFYIKLFDDREDLNTLKKNEFVHEKRIIESYEKIGEFVESGENIYTVVMTLGYKSDEIVIRKLISKNFKYLGVLGSRAKMKTLLRNLEIEGFDRKKLANIRTPIGVQINSRTPEEIAVSIAAEIVRIKNTAV